MKRPSSRRRPYYAFVLVPLLLSTPAFTQIKKSSIIKYDNSQYDGQVQLTDGTLLDGRLLYNENEGYLRLFVGEESRTFNAQKIIKFSYYDPGAERIRLFYALEFPDPKTGAREPHIYEILKTVDSFMVLSKIDRIRTAVRTGPLQPATSPLMAERHAKKFTQTETVYFLNPEGNLQPYLKILETEVDGVLLDYNETRNRYIDADLFEAYTGRHYPALRKFAKENRLSFKTKSGIVRILEEYERLTQL